MRPWLWIGAAALIASASAPAAQAQPYDHGWNGGGDWHHGGGRPPPGSYLQSCTHVRTTGGRDPQLTATCGDMRGRARYTSLYYARCVGDIGNNNGQLVCNYGRRGGW
jgi:hypothetical protein